jgi:cytochrome P450
VHEAVDAVQRQVNARVEGSILPELVPIARHRRFHRGMRALDRLAARAAEKPSRLLSALAAVEGSATLRDQVVTLLMAGHETAANTLSWALSLLARHPEAQARVREEARAVGPVRSVEAARRLVYSRQVIEETLRLYPPLYLMTRRALEDDLVCGYRIPRGSMVMVSLYASQRHPELFPEPDAFRPERFAGAATEPWRAAYLPFGVGARACIGRGLAMGELPVLLAALCSRLSFSLEGAPPATEALITLRPRGGLRLRVAPDPATGGA